MKKRAFVFGFLLRGADDGREKGREGERARKKGEGMQLQFVPLTVRGKNGYCLAGEKRIELL